MHDFLQFWWELIALNTRKTVFRVRGGRAPCQAQIDSGRALETHCEACALWNKPGRFSRVCPLLAWTDDGWRCSVDAADVRPFWGRALAYYGGALAVFYVVATIAAFALFREAGYDVRYRDVAWPPAWRHFDAIRSRHFFTQARTALAENQIGEAGMELSLAYDLDPTNYEAGFALAQLWQTGSATFSDRLYARLLASHPAQATGTARAWGQALLWRGDFAQLAKLAVERLRQEPAPATPWLHALIFSSRRLHDPAALIAARALPNLSGETKSLLRLETMALGGDTAGAARILSAPLTDDASAYARYYQMNFLIEAGAARRVLELLALYGAKLPPDERVELSLAALAKAGEKTELKREAAALLTANPRPKIYEILAAHLIRFPDAELLQLTAGQLATMPWADAPEGMPANAAMLCAAGLSGEPALVAAMRTRMRRATHASLKALDRTEEFMAGRAAHNRMGNFMPALPMLPLETVYALFEQEDARDRRQP